MDLSLVQSVFFCYGSSFQIYWDFGGLRSLISKTKYVFSNSIRDWHIQPARQNGPKRSNDGY